MIYIALKSTNESGNTAPETLQSTHTTTTTLRWFSYSQTFFSYHISSGARSSQRVYLEITAASFYQLDALHKKC